jgi:Fe2+ transport system protein FeoA
VREEGGDVRLSDLPPGRHGKVKEVCGDGAIRRRLLDLGFFPNTDVKTIRRAPLGDPVVYELRGYRLCLRRSEAERIVLLPDMEAEDQIGGLERTA